MAASLGSTSTSANSNVAGGAMNTSTNEVRDEGKSYSDALKHGKVPDAPACNKVMDKVDWNFIAPDTCNDKQTKDTESIPNIDGKLR